MCRLAHLAEQLAIGQGAAGVRLVGFVDDGDLVGVLERVAVDAVEGRVELALEEPGIVAVGETAAVDGLEVLGPGEQLAREIAPELVRLCDGFLVQLLVVLKTCSRGSLAVGDFELPEVAFLERARVSYC
jgi:hypothetical protein